MADQVCKWCKHPIEVRDGKWRHVMYYGAYCTKPAEPSAAGEPPLAKHFDDSAKYVEWCECEDCSLMRSHLKQMADNRKPQEPIAKCTDFERIPMQESPKAPGVGAEPIREQLNEMFGKDKVDYAVNEATIADIRRQLQQAQNSLTSFCKDHALTDGDRIVGCPCCRIAELQAQVDFDTEALTVLNKCVLAAALPSEEAIARKVVKELWQRKVGSSQEACEMVLAMLKEEK